MNTERKVVGKKGGATPQVRGQRLVLRPEVDIFENGESIELLADLPGVGEKSLDVQVDANTLTIEGDIDIDVPGEVESLYADVRATHYRRSFTLSGELDTGRIEASLKDGLLSVSIPKREELRPRRIEIKAG